MQQPNQQSHYDVFYIRCDPIQRPSLEKVLSSIATRYATFKCLNFSQGLEKEIGNFYHQIKLTKRKIVFAVVLSSENPEACPEGCRRINLVSYIQHKDDLLFTEDSQMETEFVKRFQLDSVWVGLLYRIGTDVEELEDYLVKEQNFSRFQISFITSFYQRIEDKLKQEQVFGQELLESCRKQLQNSQQVDKFNYKVQQLIRSKFNSRIILSDITNHPHLHLLASRNYFNLIYIEGQIFKRYDHFMAITLQRYQLLRKVLNFNRFVLLDDYIYSQFIFGCLKKVKKYINRTIEQEPYSSIVVKHHKDIIREFRPSYHEYFLYICLVLKQRAACLKEAVGSIIVKQNKIISTGYNGTPVGTINCYNGGCQVCNNSQKIGTQVLSCRCIHAQYNCILKSGITSTPGAVLYSTKLPCLWCSKLIIQGKISKVLYLRSKYSSLEYENESMVKKTLSEGKVYYQQFDIPFND